MKFSEIANRLTGISTPLVGVSWQPTDLEVSAARRVSSFLIEYSDRISRGIYL